MSKGDILVVDDVPANLHLLSNMLTEQGYKVRPAINGQMALITARAAPLDLVLLDVNMPAMNGYEVCEHLKADEQTRDIPTSTPDRIHRCRIAPTLRRGRMRVRG